jgi:hypothetical protein
MSATVTASIPARTDPSRRDAAIALGGAGLLVGTRVLLWVGVQLVVAGVIVLAGFAAVGDAVNAAAGWWMVYGSIVDFATISVLVWLLRRTGTSYRELLGPSARGWQIALGAAAILVASAPAVFFSAELTAAMLGTGTPPMLAIVDAPPLASAFSVLVWPLLAELAEPVAYLGVILPALERRLGRPWLAATIVVVVWAIEHAFFPILVADGGIDLAFASYRVISVLPFLALWTALYYAFGRRLLPLMAARWVFNGGTALAVALGWV